MVDDGLQPITALHLSHENGAVAHGPDGRAGRRTDVDPLGGDPHESYPATPVST